MLLPLVGRSQPSLWTHTAAATHTHSVQRWVVWVCAWVKGDGVQELACVFF